MRPVFVLLGKIFHHCRFLPPLTLTLENFPSWFWRELLSVPLLFGFLGTFFRFFPNHFSFSFDELINLVWTTDNKRIKKGRWWSGLFQSCVARGACIKSVTTQTKWSSFLKCKPLRLLFFYSNACSHGFQKLSRTGEVGVEVVKSPLGTEL